MLSFLAPTIENNYDYTYSYLQVLFGNDALLGAALVMPTWDSGYQWSQKKLDKEQ